jgi:ABC-2 type transport system permease protein
MKTRTNLAFLLTLYKTNLKANLALRGSFLTQAGLMIANNFILFSIWWIFFQKVPEIRGWKLSEVAALYGIVTGGFGLAVIFGGGVLTLSRMIAEGELDSFLIQPKNILVHIVASRSSVSGYGDFLGALLFLGMSGYVGLSNLPLILVLLISSAIFFLSTAIIIHSFAFWLGAIESLARQFFELVVIFSVYPQSAFSGFLKLVLFTLIPAGFIGYLPVELLMNFSWLQLAAILAGAGTYVGLATAIFYFGLRHYESGSRFGVRA